MTVAIADDVVIVAPPAVLAHLARALERELRLLPEGPARDAISTTLDDIRRHTRTIGRSVLAADHEAGDGGLMTYREAADALGYESTRSISRLADRGKLERVGRRIRRSTVEALL